MIYLVLLPFLLVLHSFFVLVSAALLHARPEKLQDENFNVKYGRRLALGFLERSVQNSLSAQAARFIVMLGIVFVMLRVIEMQAFSLAAFFPLVVFILFILVVALVLVQIAWSVSYSLPEKSLCYLAYVIRPILIILRPLGFVAFKIGAVFNKRFSLDSPAQGQQNVTLDDIAELVDLSSPGGEGEEEISMMRGIVDLSETTVEEVMVPRQDVVSVNVDISIAEATQTMEKSGLSRLLVIGDSLDDVHGLFIVRDLVTLVGKQSEDAKLRDYIRPVVAISGSENLLNLLAKLRGEKSHFAVVQDEHGGVDGIVTMEDIFEEVVGDIFDETDEPKDENSCHTTLSGDLLIEGSTTIAELNEEHQFNIPEGEYDTIAGFIIHQLGKMPVLGEVVSFNGFQMIVENFSDNRINQVRLVKQ